MEDKLYWMYGFWILVSGYKCQQAVRRLIAYHQMNVPAPTDRVLLTGFWTVALVFYLYMVWRHRMARRGGSTPQKVS